jgi:hypothetical protein
MIALRTDQPTSYKWGQPVLIDQSIAGNAAASGDLCKINAFSQPQAHQQGLTRLLCA